MILHVFACSTCHHEQKHVTSTPTPLGLSYMSDCNNCKNIRTFTFVREGTGKEDWYSNTLIQVKRKRDQQKLKKAKKKDDQSDRVAI